MLKCMGLNKGIANKLKPYLDNQNIIIKYKKIEQ